MLCRPRCSDLFTRIAHTVGTPLVIIAVKGALSEDHWPEGGARDAVLAALADADDPPRVLKLAVQGMPGSGKPSELLAAAGIDAGNIAEAARQLVAASEGVPS